MPQQKAIVIGAGIAGIASAIRLAVKGYAVEVFEANAYAGGKLSEIALNDYRFDAGPSLLTMPQYINELFKLAGKTPSDYFQYQKLEVVCNYFYEDGTRFKAYADTDKFTQEILSKTSEPVAAVKEYLRKSEAVYSITNHVFLERSLHQLETFMRWDTVRSIFRLPQIDAFRTLHDANKRSFKEDRVAQFFDRYATYNGSNPYQAPATLKVIPHLEHHYGAYFPEGGMYSIIEALVKLTEELGVIFHYQTYVEEIALEKRKVKGVQVKGETIFADVVVSNMDVWFTYRQLLRQYPAFHPQRVLKQERSSSALIFYWGINNTFPDLNLHNIFFSADYKAEFDNIWNKKSIYHDPTVYVNISSKLCPGDAPAGCENWFVMINVPANDGQNWDVLIRAARENIIAKLSRILGENIDRLITCETVLDPRSIETKTSSYKGSIYGTSSNSQFAAFLRHANSSSTIKGLYFSGGSVHPGGGIPLCLLSAKIVSELINNAN